MIIYAGIIFLSGIFIFVTFLLLLVTRYRRCPGNSILVISGRIPGDKPVKCIRGGAAFVVPLLQEYAYLSLEPIRISVHLEDAPSRDDSPVQVDGEFTVAIGTEPELMENAATRLLGLDAERVAYQAKEIIVSQLRQEIASTDFKDMVRGRETLLHHAESSIAPVLRKIGMVVLHAAITGITREAGSVQEPALG